MEDGFDIIQYRVKRLCNKLPLFWRSRLQLRTSRKLSPTCLWTSEKNPYFHTPATHMFSGCTPWHKMLGVHDNFRSAKIFFTEISNFEHTESFGKHWVKRKKC